MQSLIRANGFGPFYHERREFLRRVLVTVRDRNWREVAPVQWDCAMNETARSIDVLARHTSELVDFQWRGTLQLGTPGTLSFVFEGRALRAMEVCRLGLVVLHPADSVAGAVLTTHGPDGQRVLTLPQSIVPQSIVNGLPTGITEPFSSMSIERAGFGRLDLTLAGDLFELEDQRNWGDASFKTYCTPLRVGFPRKIERGMQISHRVAATFHPSQDFDTPQHLKIGRVLPNSPAALASSDWLLGWDHIHVELDAIAVDEFERLVQRLPHNVMLEVGAPCDPLQGLSAGHVTLLNRYAERVGALILRDSSRPLPASAGVKAVRAILRGTPAAQIPLLACPTGYFVELNRNRPFDLDVDGVAFPVSSTVHGDDADTIVENFAAVGDMIATARNLTGKSRISISPLALYLPLSPAAGRYPRSLLTPWLTSLASHAAAAGVHSLTLANDIVD